MNNLFDTLKAGLPAAPAKDKPARDDAAPAAPEISSLGTAELVAAWQKDQGSKTLTAEVLKRMQPTISAAMNSYAAGMERQLSIKAATLTLSALRTFDASRGVAPATYVFHNLKRLNRLGARAQSIIPQSEYSTAERRLVMGAFNSFTDERGREPSMSELADITGLSVRRVENALNQSTVVNESSTLSEDSRRDTVGASDLTDDDYFEYVYASVDPISQKIMEWTSGRHGAKTLSNNQIAGKLRLSPAAVSQRRNKIQRLLSDARSLV